MTKLKPHDCVALKRPLPEYNLRAGDVGFVVERLETGEFLVEFTDSEGDTVALLDLDAVDLRRLPESALKVLQHATSLPQGVEPFMTVRREGSRRHRSG